MENIRKLDTGNSTKGNTTNKSVGIKVNKTKKFVEKEDNERKKSMENKDNETTKSVGNEQHKTTGDNDNLGNTQQIMTNVDSKDKLKIPTYQWEDFFHNDRNTQLL